MHHHPRDMGLAVQRARVSEQLRGRHEGGEGRAMGGSAGCGSEFIATDRAPLAAAGLEFWNLEIAANPPGEKIGDFDVSGNSFGRTGRGVGPERVCGPFALENTTV